MSLFPACSTPSSSSSPPRGRKRRELNSALATVVMPVTAGPDTCHWPPQAVVRGDQRADTAVTGGGFRPGADVTTDDVAHAGPTAAPLPVAAATDSDSAAAQTVMETRRDRPNRGRRAEPAERIGVMACSVGRPR